MPDHRGDDASAADEETPVLMVFLSGRNKLLEVVDAIYVLWRR
jgi:hypothetical protein